MTLVMFVLGCGVGIGILVLIAGVRGHAVLPIARERHEGVVRPGDSRTAGAVGEKRNLWLVAIVVGAVVWLITGWFAAGLIGVCAAAAVPRLFGGQAARKQWIAKTQAIATWTEMLRDTMAAADGVEEAIAATVPIAPELIRREVALLDARRRSEQPLADALAQFGAELDHPSADLVVAALSIAAEGEGSDFVGVLTRLAAITRDEVRMRLRVEASRSQLHTASRMIIAVLALAILALSVLSKGYLEPYRTVAGQMWLVVVGALFALGVLLLDRMSHIDLPERFTARRPRRTTG
jgi:tight adherence protein B